MTPARKSTPLEKKNVTTIGGDVVDSVIVTGDNNQTIIQKFFNIFKSDSETLEQRNRRILLGHVENAWIKGVLDASLHGAALLDLGIKQDPEAVTKYPWAIKKESTDETLPSGTSMLEIFDSIGMGRSLLILGAPGSGKTTMLLELARQLIKRAREDVTEPIPMVFNLASWTEKLTLTDWLAQELNNLYSVPRKTAPDWVKGSKLLLLLDGLDEVRQNSRAKCVDAINAFRKEYGLTSLAVCSRSQDYADLNAKLSFEGAIKVQPLTQEQIHEFFDRLGGEMAGIKQVLKRDTALREMAETPLFLSIMIVAYRGKHNVDILVSQDEKTQLKHLFDTYIENMLERSRPKSGSLNKQNISHWLSWLARQMILADQSFYIFEDMQSNWLGTKRLELKYKLMIFVCRAILIGSLLSVWSSDLFLGFSTGLISSLIISGFYNDSEIKLAEVVHWNWKKFISIFIIGIIFGGCFVWLLGKDEFFGMFPLSTRMFLGFGVGVISGLFFGVVNSIRTVSLAQTVYVGQKINSSIRNSSFIFILTGLIVSIGFGFIADLKSILVGLIVGIICGLYFGGFSILKHYLLRLNIYLNNLLPWRLVPFLDHCVDLIFLRRVGGGYIFVHRLLMEHFAEMYVETPTSKGN